VLSWYSFDGIPVASGTELLSATGRRVSTWDIWKSTSSAVK